MGGGGSKGAKNFRRAENIRGTSDPKPPPPTFTPIHETSF